MHEGNRNNQPIRDGNVKNDFFYQHQILSQILLYQHKMLEKISQMYYMDVLPFLLELFAPLG